jgi:hypothetical protein
VPMTCAFSSFSPLSDPQTGQVPSAATPIIPRPDKTNPTVTNGPASTVYR